MGPGKAERHASDEDLVRMYQSDPTSDRASTAVEELLGRYRSRVYAWCYRMVRNPEQALDLAQDSLLNAYRGLDRIGEESRFPSWLFAIVRNRCLSALRARALLEDDLEPDTQPSSERDPLDRLVEEEDQQRLIELVRRTFTPTEQEAVWLRCFEKMPVDEITRVINVTGESGARALLQTARRKLRSALGQEGGTR